MISKIQYHIAQPLVDLMGEAGGLISNSSKVIILSEDVDSSGKVLVCRKGNYLETIMVPIKYLSIEGK